MQRVEVVGAHRSQVDAGASKDGLPIRFGGRHGHILTAVGGTCRRTRRPSIPSAIMTLAVRPIEPRDLPEIRAELHTHWHSNQIWSLGRCH
jgi:hypothetical protein